MGDSSNMRQQGHLRDLVLINYGRNGSPLKRSVLKGLLWRKKELGISNSKRAPYYTNLYM